MPGLNEYMPSEHTRAMRGLMSDIEQLQRARKVRRILEPKRGEKPVRVGTAPASAMLADRRLPQAV